MSFVFVAFCDFHPSVCCVFLTSCCLCCTGRFITAWEGSISAKSFCTCLEPICRDGGMWLAVAAECEIVDRQKSWFSGQCRGGISVLCNTFTRFHNTLESQSDFTALSVFVS
ncbi:hypothetical protein QBC40DRAFT_68929 [Triangularia verruculosa]|uniref:Secreted protein n=1 Tax=Triangularia verruculosa TaxID=2587418 RepID=A0AAN7AV73_9PEZI|nr:hypothetical protein QBC40DRAFT_68929 [Triangularia verruculosa]